MTALDLYQVWSKCFGHLLAIREEGQHSKCTVCIKHKLIVKKLGSDRIAREAQLQQYLRHLDQQYEDRVVYWQARANSRLKMLPDGTRSVCIIVDAVDHTKLRYPKHAAMSAKDFSGFIRPCLDCTAAITHGHGIVIALSEPFVKKDSSWSIDVIAHVHALSQVAQRHDLRQMEVVLQADNTSRECKNNSLLRWAAMMVGLHMVKRMELRFLMSGHSHEDVDGFFSQLVNEIEGHKNLESPDDFQALIAKFLEKSSTRPEERQFQHVVMVDSVRDWTLGASDPPFLLRAAFL